MNANNPQRLNANQTPYRLEATGSWSQEMFSHTQQVVAGAPSILPPPLFDHDQPCFTGAMIAKPGSAVAEDQWWVDETQQVAAIVDGVSSQLGALASRQAVAALQRALAEHPPTLSAAALMQRMNQALLDENQRLVGAYTPTPDAPEAKVMLASALVVRLAAGWLHYCHLGDCRLMVWREGVLHNLTEDHSLLQEALSQGTLRADERWMIDSPLRHVLTRCLGEWQVDYPAGQWQLADGDVVFLCSDGLTHTLLHSDLSAVFASFAAWQHRDFGARLVEVMLNKAENQGLSDDLSIIMIGNLAGFSPETRAC